MLDLNQVHIGDCLDLMPAIDDHSVDMILADLPYACTQNSWDSMIPLEPLWREYKRVIKSGGAIVLTAQQPFSSLLVTSNPRWFRYSLVWAKTMPVGFLNANRMPLRAHEDILVFYDRLPTYHPQKSSGHRPYRSKTGTKSPNYGRCLPAVSVSDGDRHATSVLTYQHDRGLHPTQKPVALMDFLIRSYTDEGEVVLDNTCGSGSTLVAAQAAGRQYIGIEMSPEYAEIARGRLA